MGNVEERWWKMKFTGKFLKGLPLPPVALSIKHFLSDRPKEQEGRFPVCERSIESSPESCGEDCSTLG